MLKNYKKLFQVELITGEVLEFNNSNSLLDFYKKNYNDISIIYKMGVEIIEIQNKNFIAYLVDFEDTKNTILDINDITNFSRLEKIVNRQDIITEYCSYCNAETEIYIKGGYCKYCGHFLAPCSLCDKKDCLNCKYKDIE